MDLVYCAHAVTRMQERQITHAHVERIVFDPDGMIRQSRDKVIFYKRFRDRRDNLLAVVVVEAGVRREVVTVMIHFEVSP